MSTIVEPNPKLRTEVWAFLIAMVTLNFIFITAIGEGILDRGYFGRGRLLVLLSALAGAVVLWRGIRALFELVRPLTVWQVPPIWFVLALCWPVVFTVCFLLGWSFLTQTELLVFNQSGIELLSDPGFLVRLFILALISEIVWVGYTIRILSKFYALVIAALITGTFWSMWWYPMLVYEMGIIPGLSIPALWVGQVGVAMFCAFFYAMTRSGLVILVMQFCYNCCLLAFLILPGAIGLSGYMAYSGLYLFLGLVAVLFVLPRLAGKKA